uniref:SAM domain-containing protein n=1 Tax=Macrostomum lignano TaxID=282301 RepID=A0A1I8FRP0_9PLAT
SSPALPAQLHRQVAGVCLQFAKSQDKFFRSYFPDLPQRAGRRPDAGVEHGLPGRVCALGIGYNMYFKNDSELYRRLAEFPSMVDSAKPYLVSPVTRVSATALIFIAFAVGDSQAEIFLGAKKSINYLISILRLGLKAPERACDGYSVAEMSKFPEAQDVQEGLEILFTLSFSQRAAERIKTEFRTCTGAVTKLDFSGHIERLQSVERWSSSRQLNGLAFRLLGGQRSGGEAREPARRYRRVMISYNHASKQQQIKLLSLVCFPEAEYAWKCGKKLIPVLMEPKYKATGWLGMLLGTQLYFDLTESKYPFEEKFSQLLPAIQSCLDAAEAQSPPPAAPSAHASAAAAAHPATAPSAPTTAAATIPAAAVSDNFEAWDTARVARWCSECGLPHQVADMRLTGRELRFLLGAMARSPEFLGRLLERYFSFDRLHDMAALVETPHGAHLNISASGGSAVLCVLQPVQSALSRLELL